jgi:hypothetical protein
VCTDDLTASVRRALVLTLALSVASQHVAHASLGDVEHARQQAHSEMDFHAAIAAAAAAAAAIRGEPGALLDEVLSEAALTHETSAKHLETLAGSWEDPPEPGVEEGLEQPEPWRREPMAPPQTLHVAMRQSEHVPAGEARVGSHLVLSVSNLGLEAGDVNVVTFDGVPAPSYVPGDADTELRTIVPYLTGGLPRVVELVAWRNDVAGPPLLFEVWPPAPLPAGEDAGSIFRALLAPHIAAADSYARWDCSTIYASTLSERPDATPSRRAAFLAACDGLVAEQREARLRLGDLAGLLDQLVATSPLEAEEVAAYLVPSLPLLATYERRTLPPISDPDADGLPSFVDNCPTVPNAGQADADGSRRGDACEPGVNLNSLFELSSTETSIDPEPVPGGPAGTLTLRAQFVSVGSRPMHPHVFEVVVLSGGNVLLNADHEPGGVGARVSLSPRHSSGGTVVFPGQPLPDAYWFLIGLQSREPFTFMLDVVGAPEQP